MSARHDSSMRLRLGMGGRHPRESPYWGGPVASVTVVVWVAPV